MSRTAARQSDVMTLAQAAQALHRSRRWLQDWLRANPADRYGVPFYAPLGRGARRGILLAMPMPYPPPDPSRTLADLVSDDYERIVVSCCGWIHHVPIGPHAHARPDQTGAQFAARLICRKCGKRPEDYRIERSPTHGYKGDVSLDRPMRI